MIISEGGAVGLSSEGRIDFKYIYLFNYYLRICDLTINENAIASMKNQEINQGASFLKNSLFLLNFFEFIYNLFKVCLNFYVISCKCSTSN